jgi:hypothetical protein
MIIKRDKIKYLRNFFIFLDTMFIRIIILIGIQKLLLFDNLNLLDLDFLFLIFGCILFAIFIEFFYILIEYFIQNCFSFIKIFISLLLFIFILLITLNIILFNSNKNNKIIYN